MKLPVSKRALLGFALFAVLSHSAPGDETAPRLHALRLDGTSFSLESLKGNVVLLDFWASWCVPCRTSFPFFDALQMKYREQGLRVVGVTLEESADPVLAFLDSVPVGFTIARDPSARAGDEFNVVAMPTAFLLDREGRVAARFEGGDRTVHARIERAVVTLLSGRSLPPGSDVRAAASLEATGSLRAWERSYLADPIMSLDGARLTRVLHEHVHASKEGAAGDGGPAGGGCGCN